MGDIASPDHDTPAHLAGHVDDITAASSSSRLLSGATERSSASGGSTPDQEGYVENDHEPEPEREPGPDQPLENRQQQKRKGGRKPIYATSEERKQRNRQAQAAFRERRTEYIKQLESTIKVHEENLQNLQQSHRNAADECLMLRYKNSLLERILIEKGIDVQAELHAKTGSPNLGPSRAPSGPASTTPASQPIPRFPTGKFPANRRSLSGTGIITSKPDGMGTGPQQMQERKMVHNQSPLAQAMPGSQISSPNIVLAKSPNFIPQGGAISPSFGPVAQQTQQLRPQHAQQQQQPLRPQYTPPMRTPLIQQQPLPGTVSSAASSGALNNAAVAGAVGRDSYYPPQFKDHYDQLEEEYNAQADMVDDQDQQDAVPPFPSNSYGAPPPPPSLAPQSIPQGSPIVQPNHSTQQNMQPQHTEGGGGGGAQFSMPNGLPQGGVFEHFDPMIDADPFGLTASMHFPTQYSFESQR